jgi:hypothetical protein
MRRSRALTLFGWFLTLLAVATVTVRSHAADRMRSRAAASGVLAASRPEPQLQLQLLPRLTSHEAALFGSFVKPGAAPLDVPPGEAGCPPEMVEVEGDYCPYVQQK